MHRLLILLVFCCLPLGVARAQSVRWDPSSGSLALGQESELNLVFSGCEPTSPPAVPRIASFTLQNIGQQTSTEMNEKGLTKTATYSYSARPNAPDRVTIPSFTVNTDKGRLQVPAVTFEVVQAPGQKSVTLESIVNSRFAAPAEVWAGEVFPLTYTFNGNNRLRSLEPSFEWASAPLNVEEWSKPERSDALVNGEKRLILTYRTRGLLRAPETVTLNQSTHTADIVTGVDMFRQPTLSRYAITSNRPQISVKPLPDGAPENFNGAVGHFQLESKIVPATAAVGDPITWTLTLTGTGNWSDIPGLPAREASKDFRVVQPQAKRSIKEGTLFDASLAEDVVLIPTRPGNYTLGPVSWSYFDPAAGAYRTVTTEKISVNVTAAPAAETLRPTAANGQPSPSVAAPTPLPLANAPAAPLAIPRDPLPGHASTFAPLSKNQMTLWLCAPLPLLLLGWFRLALRRARASDPLNPQRAASARLIATIAALRSASDRGDTVRLIQSWQRDTALLWNLSRAVPTARDFQPSASSANAQPPATSQPPASTSAPSAPSPASSAASLAVLWAEAERCLYRADTPLPADWATRAEAALRAKPVRPFSSFSLFRPRNLLPFAAALALLALAQPARVEAAELAPKAATAPLDLYAQGNFSAAETGWRDTLADAPTDWIARHNLALALAQQDRWQEAAAQATVAFVQSPADPSVRWHFQLALQKAGYTPVVLGDFLKPSPLHTLAAHASPSRWQHALIASSFLGALAIALGLARTYGNRSRLLRALAALFALSATALSASAALSLRLYREAGDARAVLVWRSTVLRSIPTEADTAQKTSPLSAGSIALVSKTFLGWTRLDFPGGQTGWVRKDDLVALWK